MFLAIEPTANTRNGQTTVHKSLTVGWTVMHDHWVDLPMEVVICIIMATAQELQLNASTM